MKINAVSLNWYLPFFFIGSLLLLWLILVWFTIADQKQELVSSRLEFVRYDLSRLLWEINNEIPATPEPNIDQVVLSRGVLHNYIHVVVSNAQGQIISALEPYNIGKSLLQIVPAQPELLLSWQQQTEAITLRVDQDKLQILGYAPVRVKPAESEIRAAEKGLVFVRYSFKSEHEEIIAQNIQNSVLLALIITLCGAALILFTRRYIGEPIQGLMRMLDQFAIQNLDYQLKVQGEGEFGRLAKAFNAMSKALNQEFQSRILAQQKSKEQSLIIDNIFKSIPDIFFLIDSDSTILDFKTGEPENLLLAPELFINKKMIEVVPPTVATQFNDAMQQLKAKTTKLVAFDYQLQIKSENKQFEARVSELSPHSYVVIVRDISQQKAAEQKILFQAHYDALTHLPNRFLALDRLSQLIKDAERHASVVGVLFIDLDDFKKINDTLGHQIGDKLLIEIAKRLLDTVRKGDTVARLGGDEFLVLLGELEDLDAIAAIAQNVLQVITKPVVIDTHEMVVSGSIGISLYPNDGETSFDLLRNADAAMYHSKQSGRNRFSYFTESINKDVARRLLIEEKLRGAIGRNELSLVFQPKISLATGQLFGVEALLRWHNTDLGAVPVKEFIAIAEHSSIIHDIGNFVIAKAMQALQHCQQLLGRSLNLAINISPNQFRDHELVNYIRQQATLYQMIPSQLELEITEGVLLTSNPLTLSLLNELRTLGIQLAMDDFGTGFSSLSYLRNHAFNVLKIDREFVKNLTESKSDQQLVTATIAMGKALNLQVVAEGVETLAQAQLLKRLGCDLGQGFYFARPMPIGALCQWANNYHIQLDE